MAHPPDDPSHDRHPGPLCIARRKLRTVFHRHPKGAAFLTVRITGKMRPILAVERPIPEVQKKMPVAFLLPDPGSSEDDDLSLVTIWMVGEVGQGHSALGLI